VEELTQSLMPLSLKMDGLDVSNAAPRPSAGIGLEKPFPHAVAPVLRELYDRVASGKETKSPQLNSARITAKSPGETGYQ